MDVDRFLQNYFGSILPPSNLENHEKVVADLLKTYSQAKKVDGQKLLVQKMITEPCNPHNLFSLKYDNNLSYRKEN